MIQNPTKKIVVNFSTNEVEVAIGKVPNFISNCSMNNSDSVLHEHTLNFSEILSTGSRLVVNLNEISETKTEINLEVKIVVGAFDKPHEITNANSHIDNFTSTLSKLLQDKNLEPTEQELKTQANQATNSIIISVFIVALIVIYFLS